MDRNERARRRATFSGPRQAAERDRSLAHALELEDEAEREAAAQAPRRWRRTTGRFVAICAIAVFVASSLGLLVLMVDRYQAQVFMRDHGVATQAVIIDKTYSEPPPKSYERAYCLAYRFWLRSASGSPTKTAVEGCQNVSSGQYAATSVGQTVTVRYNPQRLSQVMIYFAPPPSNQQMIVRDALLFGVWTVLFGGVCAVVVGLAWPERARTERIPKAWIYR